MDFTLGTLERLDPQHPLTWETWSDYCENTQYFTRGEPHPRSGRREHTFQHCGEITTFSEVNGAVVRTDQGAVIFMHDDDGLLFVYFTDGAYESAVGASAKLCSDLKLELHTVPCHVTELQKQALEIGEHLAIVATTDGSEFEAILFDTSNSLEHIYLHRVDRSGEVLHLEVINFTDVVSIRKSTRSKSDLPT